MLVAKSQEDLQPIVDKFGRTCDGMSLKNSVDKNKNAGGL